MEPETSLPYSQKPATCPYPEPAPSSPHNPLPLPEDLHSPHRQIYTDTRIRQCSPSGRSGANSELIILYMVKYICIYMEVQMKSKLQNDGTGSTTARHPHRLYYRPSVSYHQFRLTALSYTLGTIQRPFQRTLFHNLLIVEKQRKYEIASVGECLYCT
jgi:hypothetical protein